MARPAAIPRDLPAFLQAIEEAGELRRVQAEVESDLEITEIACRVVRGGGPALLFEKVRGSPYPLCINLFASPRRLEIALGRPPRAIARELENLLERVNPPTVRGLFQSRSTLWRLAQMRTRRVRRAPSQAVVEEPDLSTLPILRCWPEDGGRFITYPLVITHGSDGRRNLGLYRMQVHSPRSTGMHWQIQKGGGFHHHRAEAEGRDLPAAVAIGADPVLLIAAMSPLPEGVDEAVFSGFLRGKPTRMARARSLEILVPADAEFVLEGLVPPRERMLEGPFGDHYGHYSHAAPFPVFHLRTVTRKRRPIYHAAVVGRPPQEDLYLGNAVQEMFLPLLRAARPEIREVWAHYEGGFHTLLVVSMESRYAREGMKTALGLLGEGQLSLTKMLVVVGPETSPRDFPAVLRALAAHFDPARDFLLLPNTAMDTLDFSSFTLNLGSKMVLDATGDLGPGGPPGGPLPPGIAAGLESRELGIARARLLEGALLAVQMARGRGEDGRRAVEELIRRPELAPIKLVVAVSDDVELDDPVSFLWGFLTRFEPARDVCFARSEIRGARPVHGGPMGIDATFKAGYPAPLVMDPAVVERVDRRWDQLFPGGVAAARRST
jgi:UbiD family decarboxylase